MTGSDVRLGRLFDRDSGHSFITAFDHGVTGGPKGASADALGLLARIIEGNPDGILISPGMMKQAGSLFAFRGAPVPIVRADWIFNYEVFPGLPARLQAEEQGEQYDVLCSPAEAAALGAEAITMFLIVGHREGRAFTDNVRAVAKAAQQARVAGIPLIVESVLWGSRVIDNKQDPELLAFAARVATELGADAIKTAYTGDPETMRQVIAGTPVPVLVLGGARTGSPEPVLEATRGALAAGAKGVVYGRNVWQADDPVTMCGLLREVIHAG